MRHIAEFLISILLLAVGAGTCNAKRHERALQETCQEDESCWDCRTMGNRVCGAGM